MSKQTQNDSVMPKVMRPQVNSFSLWEIITPMTDSDRLIVDQMAGRAPNEFEWLGPFVLPPFQRPAVWTTDQAIRFIESIWMGYDIGRYTVVDTHMGNDRFDSALIDGQQRIRALLRYVDSQFPVLGYLYKDLPRIDKRRFENTIFPRVTIRESLSEQELREMYNRMNYGGTPHQEHERA